jgi:hypothetical protein
VSLYTRETEQGIGLILDRIPEGDRPQVIRSIRLLREAAADARNHLDCC